MPEMAATGIDTKQLTLESIEVDHLNTEPSRDSRMGKKRKAYAAAKNETAQFDIIPRNVARNTVNGPGLTTG